MKFIMKGAKLGEERGRVQGITEGLVAREMKKARETGTDACRQGHVRD